MMDRMGRSNAITRAHAYFDGGSFLTDLSRRVAIPSSSQEPERAEVLRVYLADEIVPALMQLGFDCRILDNRLGPPALSAVRIESPDFLTALVYGHGDTVRGLDDLWRQGLSPWRITRASIRSISRLSPPCSRNAVRLASIASS
jgi:hypothetical protein